jgi:hypothetical protein
MKALIKAAKQSEKRCLQSLFFCHHLTCFFTTTFAHRHEKEETKEKMEMEMEEKKERNKKMA